MIIRGIYGLVKIYRATFLLCPRDLAKKFSLVLKLDHLHFGSDWRRFRNSMLAQLYDFNQKLMTNGYALDRITMKSDLTCKA